MLGFYEKQFIPIKYRFIQIASNSQSRLCSFHSQNKQDMQEDLVTIKNYVLFVFKPYKNKSV